MFSLNKGRFLEKLAHGAFSGTNGEDAVEHNEKFLNSVEPINIQNVSSNRLRLSVFPVSLTGAASEWFREECIVEKANVVEMLWDLNNNEFKKWLASYFDNYMMMDHVTMNALWKLWNKNNDQDGRIFRRIDEEVNNNREPWNDQIEVSENESEVAKIFRIETDVFDYESPMCKVFDEFNYFLKIDPDVPNKDIPRFKTYEQYKDDWIYEWNDKIPCVSERPWVPDGTWKKPDLDYEWYKALVDCELKDEALRNKAELDKSMNHDGESNDDAWSNYSPIEEWSDQGKGFRRSCTHNLAHKRNMEDHVEQISEEFPF
ncbi:hypothetical protein Tco_0128092 [Tanacetum coccineum]